jgi:uncharacterized membrane protein YphA (DoxX/SURF4 family)
MSANTVRIEEPPIARMLFSDTRFGWLWLPLRLYLGYMWFEAGWHKFVDPKWMGSGESVARVLEARSQDGAQADNFLRLVSGLHRVPGQC